MLALKTNKTKQTQQKQKQKQNKTNFQIFTRFEKNSLCVNDNVGNSSEQFGSSKSGDFNGRKSVWRSGCNMIDALLENLFVLFTALFAIVAERSSTHNALSNIKKQNTIHFLNVGTINK
jgi:hypothetical protein